MKPELKVVLFEEKKILQELLRLLDDQHGAILAKDVMSLEKLTEKLDHVGRNLASVEIKRRNLLEDDDFKTLMDNSDDEHMKSVYEEIKEILKNLEIQKKVNDTLIKQQLFFTSKMINVIRPSKNIGTYNSYGKIGR
ncbi:MULTISPECIES: flagellar protein FlgN [Clostridium]|uniref:flagellar protein FlgN n=1 Tax=Clostridium TaxID=1485 RepID=UPI00041EA9BC|nr:flagellar protein FlgN [Clostridium cadaveris]MDU4950811.1 flagellar protein FlgN [Clostridium sp.]NME63725.1 flagellar protein FlgN [Clostridium cadaveris]NWK12579.1 flagellar protein FlgN [Clostridium cadaveris]